ncbi:unnamed protein product [Heligmosomoides polygyrus]|uniref:AP2/ERF domain-containing protein n=1 Tax=Heligmosomoides polygyrus TaxID=6339 RepID=A0A183GHF1_HELPZ|nr:unnamed protein product [Heligmosomoides polygyrus]
MAVDRQREGQVREKKTLYHMFLGETADNWRKYQEAKKAAKKDVAIAIATRYGDANERLEKLNPRPRPEDHRGGN